MSDNDGRASLMGLAVCAISVVFFSWRFLVESEPSTRWLSLLAGLFFVGSWYLSGAC